MGSIKHQTSTTISKTYNPKQFHIQRANGQLVKPKAIVTSKVDFWVDNFAEHFVVTNIFKGPTIMLRFTRQNKVIFDATDGPICFSHFTLNVKNDNNDKTAKPPKCRQKRQTDNSSYDNKTITSFIEFSSKWTATGFVNPTETLTKTARLLILHSMSSLTDKKVELRITETTESPYTTKKKKHAGKFAVVVPNESKFPKLIESSVIPEGDPDLTKYLSDGLCTNKPEDHSSNIRKLNLLVDLLKLNSLIADGYTSRNHPVGTLSDAAHYLAANSIFRQLEWSQAYHCI